MPLIQLTTSPAVPANQREKLLAALSILLAEATGKPEKYVMAVIGEGTISMAGKAGPAAFADICGIGGLSHDVNNRISQKLCALLNEALKIPPDRVYLTFTNMNAVNWGWNGKTFG